MDDPSGTVVAFTATQIPGIAGRRYVEDCARTSWISEVSAEVEKGLAR